MATTDDCMRCTKPCPQAKLAHETAKGRMYATNELLSYVKKVESGQLVEVVRCKDCKSFQADEIVAPGTGTCWHCEMVMEFDDFCSYGERKDGDGNGPA